MAYVDIILIFLSYTVCHLGKDKNETRFPG